MLRINKKVLFLSFFLFLALIFSAAPAFAMVKVTACSSAVIGGQAILPGSPPTALLNVEITAENADDTLSQIQCAVASSYNVTTGDIKRVSVYQDALGEGTFSSDDSLIASSGNSPTVGSSLTLTFTERGVPYTGTNHKWWYFIVVETSDTLSHGDAFYGVLGSISGNHGGTAGDFSGAQSAVIQCECKVADVFYTESNDYLQSWGLVHNLFDEYWHDNYIPYSIYTEMTEPNESDPEGTPHSWYLTSTGNFRYSYLTGLEGSTIYAQAFSNLQKFERRRKLLQMQKQTPILGLKIAGKNQYQSTGSGYYDGSYLNDITIDFTDTDSANFNARDMLFSLNSLDESMSGVSVYRDSNNNGVLDESELPLDITGATWNTDYQVTLHFYWDANSRLPQTYNAEIVGTDDFYDPNSRTGTDFLVVIRARPESSIDTDKIGFGADFTAKVTSLGCSGVDDLVNEDADPRDFWNTTKEIKAVAELHDYTPSRVDPDSLFPVVGINAVDGPGLYEKIYSVTLQIKATDYFNPNTDLSGVYIYKNDSQTGVFSPADTMQSGITAGAWTLVENSGTDTWWETTMSCSPGLDVPDSDAGIYQGDDYYVVLRSSDKLGYLDQMTCRVPDAGVVFSNKASAAGTGLITNAQLRPVSNTKVNWQPFANPQTPLPGNVAVKFYDSITPDSSFVSAGSLSAMLGFELSSNTTADTQPVFKSVVVQLINTTAGESNINMSDLVAMTNDSSTSGLGIWQDDGDGVFDPDEDTPLDMAAPPTSDVSTSTENYQRFLLVLDEAQPVKTSFSASGRSDYFVTLKTKTEAAGDQFLVRLWGSEMKPPSSYGLGFRTKITSLSDAVTPVEAVFYTTSVLDADAGTLSVSPTLASVSPALAQSEYSQNWYVVATDGTGTAKGKVRKVLGVNSLRNTLTCEDLTGLNITQARIFKLDGTSYRNHSVGVTFTGDYSVSLSAASGTTSITLTWSDNTPSGVKTFVLERKDYTAGGSFVTIASGSEVTPFKYVDSSSLVAGHVYYYRITVTVEGVGTYVSNTVSGKLSTFFTTNVPENLEAAAGIKSVELSWDWPDGYKIYEDGFSIERRPESGTTWTVVGTTPGSYDNFGTYTDSAFTDTMLESENTYVYRVRAFKYTGTGIAYSDYSESISIEVAPDPTIPDGGSGGGSGGGAVGPIAAGLSGLLGWWKRRKREKKTALRP